MAATDPKHLPNSKGSETETNLPSAICINVTADEDEYLGKNETTAADDQKHLPNGKG